MGKPHYLADTGTPSTVGSTDYPDIPGHGNVGDSDLGIQQRGRVNTVADVPMCTEAWDAYAGDDDY